MPPHGHARTRGVRYSDATQSFEIWCPDCDTFLPADLALWAKGKMQRCRACEAAKKRRVERERRRALGKDLIRERNAAYFKANQRVLQDKHNARRRARRSPVAPAESVIDEQQGQAAGGPGAGIT